MTYINNDTEDALLSWSIGSPPSQISLSECVVNGDACDGYQMTVGESRAFISYITFGNLLPGETVDPFNIDFVFDYAP